MNILFLDNDKELKQLLKYLDSIGEINIFFCKDYAESISIYKSVNIDMVIINFTFTFGEETLNYILKENPQQRVITVSDILECSEVNGGIYCQQNYNKIRLLKPINTSQLVNCIKYFDNNKCQYCGNFETNNGLINIMDDVIRRFKGATYNKEIKTIDVDHSHKMIDIIQFLDNKNIDFQITKDTSIQINQ